ncbi:MAG: hypothetical protein V2B18_03510 [Pseudomonadota bacterium]
MITYEDVSVFLASAPQAVERYGSILRKVENGDVVGILKETGDLAQTLGTLPLTPGDAVAKVFQATGMAGIKESLQTLQIISSVGALTSVATLGVCAVGFMCINNRLKRLEGKLDEIMKEVKEIRREVERLNIRWDALTLAKLQTAGEQLSVAQESEKKSRRDNLLQTSSSTFAELNNYYYSILQHGNIWQNGRLPIDSAIELHSRFVVCSVGQLHAEFLLGDMSAFRATWKLVTNKMREIGRFDKKSAFRARADYMATHFITVGLNDLARHINNAYTLATENYARVETMIYEADYIEKRGIDPLRYVRFLREQPSNIILLRDRF